MRYIVFVIDSETGSADTDEVDAIDSFNEKLKKQGSWITAAGIAGPSRATLIDNRGSLIETPGSLFAEHSFYSGFWLIEAESPNQATELAREASKACNRRVELRPYL